LRVVSAGIAEAVLLDEPVASGAETLVAEETGDELVAGIGMTLILSMMGDGVPVSLTWVATEVVTVNFVGNTVLDEAAEY